jgi:cysteine desulfurase
MMPYLKENYGNASSQHLRGREAKAALETARETIAKKLNAKPEEIFFTSGGTESNNLALKGSWLIQKEKNHIITTKIEHDSVLNPCKRLESLGAKITYLDVDKEGYIDLKNLENAITDFTNFF